MAAGGCGQRRDSTGYPMHYYKLNIPDWNLSTSHLTLEEEAIYFRLVNHYYDTEQPFSDLEMVFRRLRIVKQTAQAMMILREFFIEQDGEWHHMRCDKELGLYRETREQQSKAGKASAVKRALNGKSTTVERPLNEPSTESQRTGNQLITNNQEPLTINQEPETKRKNTKVFSIDTMLEIGPELALEFMKHRKAVKAPLSAIAWDQFVKEAGKAGWTVEEAVRECIGRGWKSFKAEWVSAKAVATHEYQSNPFSDFTIEGECYESE